MKTALGLDDVSGFPYQLSPLKTKKALPIPALDFTEAAPSIKEIFAGPVKIYVTPDSFFVTSFQRNIRTNKNTPHVRVRIKTLARRATNEILAPAAQLRGFLRKPRLRNIKGSI